MTKNEIRIPAALGLQLKHQVNQLVQVSPWDGIGSILEAVGAGLPFEIILLDAMMPDVDGFTLAEGIQQMPELAAVTVMMLSSADRDVNVARCRKLGLSAYLAKPIPKAALLHAILKALGVEKTQPTGPENPGFPPPPAPGVGLRVLVVEDNKVNQVVVARILEKHGHETVIVGDGLQAIQAFEAEAFDLVLMDAQMPVLDGFEATREIRKREQATGGHIPIVGLTALAMKGDQERCLEAGMDYYLTKPIRPRDLISVMEPVLRTCP